MEFKANFPYSTVSISTFQDSIYLIKRNYLRKVERTEDNFVMKIKGQTITSESIDDFRFQLAKAIGKGFFKIRLRKLSFTIKSIDWLVGFYGEIDVKNQKNIQLMLWERGHCVIYYFL